MARSLSDLKRLVSAAMVAVLLTACANMSQDPVSPSPPPSPPSEEKKEAIRALMWVICGGLAVATLGTAGCQDNSR